MDGGFAVSGFRMERDPDIFADIVEWNQNNYHYGDECDPDGDFYGMEWNPDNYFYRAEWNQGNCQFRVEWDQEYDFFCGKRD